MFAASAHANEVLNTHTLAENVYALVGPLTNRDAQNLGNNANFGVLITDEGVVLIDPGGTYKGAQMIDAAIRKLTDKPVTLVINTGGQDHRWLGNGYFKAHRSWIEAFEALAALEPEIVVPGHGDPAALTKATADSYDYLSMAVQTSPSSVNSALDRQRGW